MTDAFQSWAVAVTNHQLHTVDIPERWVDLLADLPQVEPKPSQAPRHPRLLVHGHPRLRSAVAAIAAAAATSAAAAVTDATTAATCCPLPAAGRLRDVACNKKAAAAAAAAAAATAAAAAAGAAALACLPAYLPACQTPVRFPLHPTAAS